MSSSGTSGPEPIGAEALGSDGATSDVPVVPEPICADLVRLWVDGPSFPLDLGAVDCRRIGGSELEGMLLAPGLPSEALACSWGVPTVNGPAVEVPWVEGTPLGPWRASEAPGGAPAVDGPTVEGPAEGTQLRSGWSSATWAGSGRAPVAVNASPREGTEEVTPLPWVGGESAASIFRCVFHNLTPMKTSPATANARATPTTITAIVGGLRPGFSSGDPGTSFEAGELGASLAKENVFVS